MTESPESINGIWADLVVEQLVRLGVRCFSISPGSRSAPLVSAIAARPELEPLIHYDERGSAFYALGHASVTGEPAAWITTSGTAVANGMPAIIEASQRRVPLLALTADRPPELRASGANQAIDQVKLFGDYVRWFFDMPCPTTHIAPEMVLSTMAQAHYMACRAPAGPVHVNFMFREPLAPARDGTDAKTYTAHLETWLRGHESYGSRYRPQATVAEDNVLLAAQLCSRAKRGIVMAGQLPPGDNAAVVALADELGWPLLADVTAGLHQGSELSGSVKHYDLMLASPEFAKSMRPDMVLYVGGAITSKRLYEFALGASVPLCVQIKDHPDRQDYLHRVTHSFEGDPQRFCAELATRAEADRDPQWLQRWQDYDTNVASTIDKTLGTELSEPAVARDLAKLRATEDVLMLASSMPVRDFNTYGHHDGATGAIVANRGASGIDGTLASVAGSASGLGKRATLVVGDLALLHDLNSLALVAASSLPITIVVINNDGGGIFSFLPIAEQTAIFERHFGTPHGITFENAAELFGLAYARPETRAAFAEVYTSAQDAGKSALIEVRTDRAENVALHRRVERAVSDLLA